MAQTWLSYLVPNDAADHPEHYTIFKFDFKTVTEENIKYAAWVEVRGLKRYCYGPWAGPDVQGTNDCMSQWPDDEDPAPVNPTD